MHVIQTVRSIGYYLYLNQYFELSGTCIHVDVG